MVVVVDEVSKHCIITYYDARYSSPSNLPVVVVVDEVSMHCIVKRYDA